MTSLTDLREVVDVVIGVDTHVHTHSAAAVDARTGGVLDQITVDATADGYARLSEFADEHAVLRAWAIEGTGSFGAGLTRHLASREEVVIELDRPIRAKRRNGAKSDPLDAIRAAREALARTRLGAPRGNGEHAQDRQSLSMLLTVRRSAVDAASDAQRQLFSLVITAPESIRERFRGLKASAMPAVALGLRLRSTCDVETLTAVTTLRALARRIRSLSEEAAEHEQAILAIVRSWRPDLLAQLGVGPIVAATVLCAWSHPGRIHSGSLRDARRRGTPPSQQRPSHHPLQAQPTRRPATQPRPAHHHPFPHPLRPTDARLRRAPHQRRQNTPRDQTLPQALHRPRPLPPPRTPTHHHLTIHRSVAGAMSYLVVQRATATPHAFSGPRESASAASVFRGVERGC
jgi:transposase